MSDTAAALMAVAAAVGALAPTNGGWLLWMAAAVVGLSLLVRRPAVLIVGVALAASALSARAWSGLDPPPARRLDATVTLVGDPHDDAGALRVDVRIGHRRVEAWARGRAATRLRPRLAGERIHLTGRIQALPTDERAFAAPRHIAARLDVEEAGGWSAGDLPSRLANRLRRALVGGASSLSVAQRSLFAGFVLGDDRNQPPEVAFDFRATGLTHLLVVSGENVAFVLALAGPLLRRVSLRGRLVLGTAILLLFGTLTRWEPSVLRAVAMALVALLAGALGRPASTVRLLALAATGLILIDPLLIQSIGFRLSVGACLGISVLARPLAGRLPGPRGVAEAVAVTVAAQAGVAPVMIPTFGGLPVVTLLANVLALPVAGVLMAWGVGAGVVAGAVGGETALAALVHLPTRLMIGWVAGVARVTALLPLGQIDLRGAAAVATAALVAVVAARRGWRVVTGTAVSACVLAGVAAPAMAVIRPPPVDGRDVGRGATLWRRGASTVVVLDGATGAPDRIMAALHKAGVRRVDVLVTSRPTRSEGRAAELLELRFPAGVVLGPAKTSVGGAVVPPPGSEVRVGPFVVHIAQAGDRLAVTVSTETGTTPR